MSKSFETASTCFAEAELQQCRRCRQVKPLSAYRRHCIRPNGRDTICKDCRKAAYRLEKVEGFGPLPTPAGSQEWVDEVWRRAAAVRAGRQP